MLMTMAAEGGAVRGGVGSAAVDRLATTSSSGLLAVHQRQRAVARVLLHGKAGIEDAADTVTARSRASRKR